MPFRAMDTLTVTIKHAKNLEAADWNGLSDPYVCVQAKSAIDDERFDDIMKETAKEWRQKTSVKRKTLNPEWNEEKTFHSLLYLDTGLGIKLKFEVYDWDLLSKDDAIGQAEILLDGDKLEHDKEYNEVLELTDCKSGTLYISYKIWSYEQDRVDKDFRFITPFQSGFAEICTPRQFSLVSSSEESNEHNAVFADMKNAHVLLTKFIAVDKDAKFSEICKKISDQKISDMKKEYTKVEVKSKNENVNPDPHCRNKLIANIVEYVLLLEKKGGIRMWGTFRIVAHSNGKLGLYIYIEPQDALHSILRQGEAEVARVSENTLFI